MFELFKKDGQSIFTFKRGDLIIRSEPVIKYQDSYNENLGIEVCVKTGVDESYTDKPLVFHCIENNCIYLKYCKGDILEGRVTVLPLRTWSEGWMSFVIPDGLTLQQCL